MFNKNSELRENTETEFRKRSSNKNGRKNNFRGEIFKQFLGSDEHGRRPGWVEDDSRKRFHRGGIAGVLAVPQKQEKIG